MLIPRLSVYGTYWVEANPVNQQPDPLSSVIDEMLYT